MYCVVCEQESQTQAGFCEACGYALTSKPPRDGFACRSCGLKSDSASVSCPGCGAELDVPPAVASLQRAADWERLGPGDLTGDCLGCGGRAAPERHLCDACEAVIAAPAEDGSESEGLLQQSERALVNSAPHAVIDTSEPGPVNGLPHRRRLRLPVVLITAAFGLWVYRHNVSRPGPAQQARPRAATPLPNATNRSEEGPPPVNTQKAEATTKPSPSYLVRPRRKSAAAPANPIEVSRRTRGPQHSRQAGSTFKQDLPTPAAKPTKTAPVRAPARLLKKVGRKIASLLH